MNMSKETNTRFEPTWHYVYSYESANQMMYVVSEKITVSVDEIIMYGSNVKIQGSNAM